MSYRIAKALDSLRAEINRKAPSRSKASDGWIGDAAHAQSGSSSDHNPWIKDRHGVGVVRAIDVTHDPTHGCDGAVLAESLRQLGTRGDRRLKAGGYVIFNRRIASASHGWGWHAYTGPNPHDKHVHVSVSTEADGYDEAGSWNIAVVKAAKQPSTGPALGTRQLREGLKGSDVRKLQLALNRHGAHLTIDGDFGAATDAAVRAFQRANHLAVDGIVGPHTVATLKSASASKR